jgi:hypothetical protein
MKIKVLELINKTEKFSESLSNLVKPLKLEANLKIQVGFFIKKTAK